MSNWQNVRLGESATFINGFAFKPSQWSDEGLEIIRIQNLTGSSNSVNYYSGDIAERYLVKRGDLLISWSATLGVYEWSKDTGLLNQHIFKVVFDKLDFDKKFFKHLISFKLLEIQREVHGSTMKHITKKRFDNVLIPHPPLPVQKRIAEILDLADAYRQKTKALIDKYDELAQSIFLEMFGNPVTNPKGWDMLKFEELGKLDRGKSKHRPRNAPELLGGNHPLIQTGDVANAEMYIRSYHSTYSDLGLMQSRKWQAGTLCITIAANIAKSAILTFDACFPDSVVGFIPNEKVRVEYVQNWLGFLQKTIEDSAPESAQKNINLKILRDLNVPTPYIDLQNEFCRRLDQIKKQKEQAQTVLKISEHLFQSLLQKAFKGELVTKADLEPVKELSSHA